MGDGDSSQDSPALEADLHRLFADDRLSIRPSPVAGRAVVAGARRARRRREIALVGGGSAVVALVLFAGVMLAAVPQGGEGDSVASPHRTSVLRPGQQPPMASPSSAKPDPDVTTGPGPAAERGELGPYGYGKLKLGMSFGDLQAGGFLANPKAPPPKGCTSYSLAEGEHNIREIIVSEDRGLVMFTANRARTPEGIGVGSGWGEVEWTYKLRHEQGTQRDTIYYAKAGAGADYWLRPDDGKDGMVLSLRLVSVKHGC